MSSPPRAALRRTPRAARSLADTTHDKLAAAGIACFGPSAAAAELEGSKAYSKAFLARHGLRTAAFRSFASDDAGAAAARAYAASVDHAVVVKASGLAGGKGVLLPEVPRVCVARGGGERGEEGGRRGRTSLADARPSAAGRRGGGAPRVVVSV